MKNQFLSMSKYILIYAYVMPLLFICIGCGGDKMKDSVFGQNNAVWTESIYLRGFKPSTGEELTNQHIEDYANTLKRYEIRYAYLFAGPYLEDGCLPKYTFSETAKNSIKRIKKQYPGIVLLPWVGGVQNKTVYLDDSNWVRNAVADTEALVRLLDVSGVHIDFEYILPGDSYLDTTIKADKSSNNNYGTNVNRFHQLLRSRLPEAFISSVVVATSPGTKPWKRKTNMDELKELTKYIDQLSFLYYDTGINTQDAFDDNCSSLLQDIHQLKRMPSGNQVQYLIGIGTFINRQELQKYRNTDIENIPNTLKTIKRNALLLSPNEVLVDGISIFSDWETEEAEWDQFYKCWVEY